MTYDFDIETLYTLQKRFLDTLHSQIVQRELEFRKDRFPTQGAYINALKDVEQMYMDNFKGIIAEPKLPYLLAKQIGEWSGKKPAVSSVNYLTVAEYIHSKGRFLPQSRKKELGRLFSEYSRANNLEIIRMSQFGSGKYHPSVFKKYEEGYFEGRY